MSRLHTWPSLTIAALLTGATLVVAHAAPTASESSAAEPHTPASHVQASQLSEAAYDQYTAGNFESAIVLFERAIKYDPHPVLRFNYARTLEELDKLPVALALYRALIRENNVNRVVNASRTRVELIEMRLLQEGYNPDTVTDLQYRPLATVVVRSNAPNARIFVDGRRAAEGSDASFEWRAGTRQLFVWADGYYPYQADVVFQQDGTVLEVELRERTSITDYVAPPPGLLTVAGPTAGMAIYVDGALQPKLTPARELLLPEGRYDIIVRHPLYADVHARIAVRAGEETRFVAENLFTGSDAPRLASRQRAGNALMGVGAAAIAGSVATGVLAMRSARDYREHPNDPARLDDRNRARRLAHATDGLAVGGAIIAGTGLTLRLVKVKDETVYEERLLDFAPGTVGTPFGASFSIRR